MRIFFVLRSEGFFPYHKTTVDHLIAVATELPARRQPLSADAITMAIDRELGDRPWPRIRPSVSELHELVEGIADI